MEFVWKPMHDSLGDNVEIFTGIMRDRYRWPDCLKNKKEMTTITSDNAIEYAAKMFNYVYEYSKNYRGNHFLVPMGADFAWMTAKNNFESMENLIESFNSLNTGATLLMSTPSMYLDALKSQNITWPSKTTDMMPYADRPSEYWSGYFSSRANSKSQVRFAQANFHASNKLFADKVIS